MASGPDLFVVCKNCGAEVSPYITECPYCGTRLRKRAPKIERDGTISEPRPKRSRGTRRAPRERSAPRERRIPGLGAPAYGSRPWATITLIALSCFMWIALAWVSELDLVTVSLDQDPVKLLSAAFVYDTVWYQLAVLVAVGVYGWLLERRHGPVPVVLLFLVGGVGGLAAATAVSEEPWFGANGAALALLCAWAVRDVLAARRGHDYEGDLLGTAVISAVVFLMPAFNPFASWVAGGVGVLTGALAGLLLARASDE
jgi:membrane associated rhomboid family serine protease